MEQSTETKLTLIDTQDQLSQINAQNLELQSNLQKSDIDSSSLYVRLQEQVNIKWILNFPFQFYCTHSLDRLILWQVNHNWAQKLAVNCFEIRKDSDEFRIRVCLNPGAGFL